MPYKLKKKGKGFVVASPNHPQGFSKSPQTAAKAKSQMRALYANSGPEARGSMSALIKK